METLQLVTRQSRPHCANKCNDATVVELIVGKGKKKDLVTSWQCCGCKKITPPVTADEAWQRFLASKPKRSKISKMVKWGLMEEGVARKKAVVVVQRVQRWWLFWPLVKSLVTSTIRRVKTYLRSQLQGLYQQELPDKNDQLRLAFIGDGVLNSAVKRWVASNEAMFADRGNCGKFFSAHHLARVGIRLGLADQLGLKPETMEKIRSSLDQFEDLYLHRWSLRRVSEMVEALIGQTYERLGYEAAAALVEEQIVLPYLNAPFCAAPVKAILHSTILATAVA